MLKKTLGIMDTDDADKMEQLAMKRKTKEEKQIEFELQEQREKGEQVAVVNEKTGLTPCIQHKTLKDQHGSYPPWYKTIKLLNVCARRIMHKRKFKQAWTVTNVPL
ncbi:hypothetical protein EVAR_70703_1 [Eumeta japonica]|uniref:Uncharacterized protein n=1 Tax=Eumeta variegata TaxID=151549 RepID=A0A4C1SH45_EUMVA|nr:hypothetical protein EVAR_70703_1 [Eumeta japonica]